MNAYKAHMHLHSCFVQSASMASHARLARDLGFNALFITDHDNRMGDMAREINDYALTNGQLFRAEDGCGWEAAPPESARAMKEEGDWFMRLTAAPQSQSAAAFQGGKRQQASLLAQVRLGLRLRIPASADAACHGVRVDITLSERPGDLRLRHLYYAWGACPQPEDWAYDRPLTVPRGDWAEVVLPLSKDMASADPFGEDNCFVTLGISVFNQGNAPFSIDCGPFWKTKALVCGAVRERQQRLADKIGAHYGVKLYAAQEISLCGPHKNCFSPEVPVIDYRAHGYRTDSSTALALLRYANAVYSYNHMFEPWKRERLDEVQRHQVMRELLDRLTQNRCEGATILEVGFPEGRYGFSIEEHLAIWDALAERGILLTGNGVSDSHSSTYGWLDGNNFATWLLAEDDSWPALLDAMRKGRAYAGDPTRWNGRLDLQVCRVSMGGAFVCASGQSGPVELELRWAGEPLHLTLRAHDQILCAQWLDAGEHRLQARLTAQRAVEPVRMELRGRDGRMVLISNPVYAITDESIQAPERLCAPSFA